MTATVGEIIGREDELASLDGFVARTSTLPAAFLIRGSAGIGKTTLWRRAVELARERGYRVFASAPVEAEARLSFAALGDLLADLDHDEIMECLPAPQRHALEVALLLAEAPGTPPDRRAVAVAFLAALRAMSAQDPLLLAVDDVQWLDPPSRSVLAFAVRRLRDAQIALLAAERIESDKRDQLRLSRAFQEGGLQTLELRPLSVGALHRLLNTRLAMVVSRPTLLRLHGVSGGNPFFALELARALKRRGGRVAPGEPLPVAEQLEELLQETLAVLPRRTREALGAAAALSRPTVELLATALGVSEAALRPAVAAHVIGIDSGGIKFAHPLLASAAYGALDTSARRALHGKLAAAVADVEERARHLAAAATGPDSAVADALDQAARLARARGAPAAAAELAELAARLTPPLAAPEVRRRLIAGGEHRFEAGDGPGAMALLEEALAGVGPGQARARILTRIAQVRSYGDDIREAGELFLQAVTEAGDDIEVAADAHEGMAAILFRLRERLVDSVEHARAAVELRRGAGSPGHAAGIQLVAEAALAHPRARSTLETVLALQHENEDVRPIEQPKLHAAVAWMWWDELPRARVAYGELLERARVLGDESSVPYLLVLLGQTECLLADFDAAARCADEGAALAAQVGQQTVASYLLALRALVRAHTGPVHEARVDADRAVELARRTAGRPTEYLARSALGLLALAEGDPARAVRVLTPIAELASREGFAEPGATRFVPDLIEGLVETGRLEEAARRLEAYEATARLVGRHSALAASCRVRGLLLAAGGQPTEARAALVDALAEHEHAGSSFDRARTLLALGAIERRTRRRRAARDALGNARRTFGELGAEPWQARAAAELARIGGREPSGGRLTPTERRVAELVTRGRSNKEVAGELFMSVKTVEGHLSHIYGKLGVRSRTELAIRARRDSALHRIS